MRKSIARSGGVSLALVALLGGAVACQDGDATKSGGKADKPANAAPERTPAQVITAAYKKTNAAKSAKVKMTVSAPATMQDGGNMELSGVMGWDPTVMDVTMKGSMLASEPGAPEQVRMLWLDNVMYMDMGKAAAKDMDGKQWMKLDLQAAAKASGDQKAVKGMTGGLDGMNQDPAKQLALLLDSPNLKHMGPAKAEGEQTQHYKGTLTFEEMLDANKSLDVLSKKERDDLVAAAKKEGIKGYDTEVWVNEDDYPVKMVIGIETPKGEMEVTARYSDYGAKAEVQAPPAAETFDLFKMLKGAQDSGAGGNAA